jgi:hypothetical protein
MNVLLSKPVQEKLQKPESLLRLSLPQIISQLESINTSSLEKNNSIRRVNSAEEEIYVMRINNLRVFFTKKDKDLVLLSIENG